jgi:hypothetical protein
MDWQSQLILTYLTVCSFWKKGICESVKRYSNHSQFALIDEEVATLYLFGILSGCTTVRSIYNYSDRHLREWFPNLGGYEAFNYRLNKISTGFISLCEYLAQSRQGASATEWIVDSLPIILAGPTRSGRAKVAPDLADKGFCASKDLYFYGVKLHCIGVIQPSTIPIPCFLGVAPASASDNRMFEQVSPELSDGTIFGDKAYADTDHRESLLHNQNVELLTPIKKVKNLFSFPGGDTFSTWISSIRQPIESLFNWLQEKTKIQNASKVRSSSGLLVHIFGRIAACLILLK